MQSIPKVSVVILNYNGRGFLEKFLPSVLGSTYTNMELVVADNASTDDSVSFLKANYPSVKLLHNDRNEGFAKGYNLALARVEAAYFVLLNSDVEVTPGWIEPIIELMEGNKMIAACQPKLLAYNNKDHFEYAGASGGWIDSLGYPFMRGRVLDVCEKDHGQYDAVVPCFWASGASLFVRASAFKEAGGLDNYFFAHQEEIDLCWRLQLLGYKIYVHPGSVVYHVGGGTLPISNRKLFLNYRNNLVMICKNYPANALVWKLPLRLVLNIAAAFKELLGGKPGYFGAILKAHWAFLGWLFTGRKSSVFPATSKAETLVGVFKGCLVWEYFLRRKKTFAEIVEKQ